MLRFGYDDSAMHHLALLFIHLIVAIARLFGPGGARSVVAESPTIKSHWVMPVTDRKVTRLDDYR